MFSEKKEINLTLGLNVLIMIRFKENKLNFFIIFRAFTSYEEDTPVDKEAEERYRQPLNEYKKKFVIDDKIYPDPFTLPKA